MKKFALISVSNKEKIVEFALNLNKFGHTILATGNTAKILLENDIDCIKIEDYTSFPEIFDGRVKTLQPVIFGGILMRRDEENDIRQAAENNINPIDIICVNLYPFPEVVKRDDLSNEIKIENIDIGGPSLIRAAAKNYKFVSILTNPGQYDLVINELKVGGISSETREKLAAEAFAHTSYYDTVIADYFEESLIKQKEHLRVNVKLASEMRYGENPHQKAALYGNYFEQYEIIHGKEVSYNNVIDLDAAVDIVYEFTENACAIIKHTNPCGAALGSSVLEAYEKALTCDPVSAFGGIVAFNNKIDLQTALKLNELFLEIIVAPDFDAEALEELKKKKNRRIVRIRNYKKDKYLIKSVRNGFLVQDTDNSNLNDLEFKNVTERDLTSSELEELKFAWVICKHTKSNAIVFTKDRKAIGVGAGQMSRVDSAKIAAAKAKEHGHDLNGAVAASDAYFPFADGLEEIISQGIMAVVQPGGSVRDNEVIEAANKHKISMVFTGIRNFKH